MRLGGGCGWGASMDCHRLKPETLGALYDFLYCIYLLSGVYFDVYLRLYIYNCV